jgi:hypothetical protein
LPGEYNVSATFNVSDLSLFEAGDLADLRTDPSQEGGDDTTTFVHSRELDTVGAVMDPTSPITRARARKLREDTSDMLRSSDTSTTTRNTIFARSKPITLLSVIDSTESGHVPVREVHCMISIKSLIEDPHLEVALGEPLVQDPHSEAAVGVQHLEDPEPQLDPTVEEESATEEEAEGMSVLGDCVPSDLLVSQGGPKIVHIKSPDIACKKLEGGPQILPE